MIGESIPNKRHSSAAVRAAGQDRARISPVPLALGSPSHLGVQKEQEAITLLSSLPGALCHSPWGLLLPLGIHLGQVLWIFQQALCSSHSSLVLKFMWHLTKLVTLHTHGQLLPRAPVTLRGILLSSKCALPPLRCGGPTSSLPTSSRLRLITLPLQLIRGLRGFTPPQLLNHLFIS